MISKVESLDGASIAENKPIITVKLIVFQFAHFNVKTKV